MEHFFVKLLKNKLSLFLLKHGHSDMKDHLNDSFNKHIFNEETLCARPTARFWRSHAEQSNVSKYNYT